jgi:malate dehydrogenase
MNPHSELSGRIALPQRITISHRMREVAIVGAGELGGLTAHVLARRHAAEVVRIVDDAGHVAEGKALDISQAASVERFSTTVIGAADLSAISRAHVIVIADRAGGAEWHEEEGLALLRRVTAVAPRALLLCAGSSHRELIERGVRELRIARTRIIGSASEGLAAAAIAVVALELDVSPRDVGLAVLGVPPRHLVIAWEAATVAGYSLTGMIRDPVRRLLTSRIGALWPIGPYALASAACSAVETISGASRRLLTCFVAPDDGGGTRTRTVALPVRLGADGIEEIITPPLSAAERVALDNAMLL